MVIIYTINTTATFDVVHKLHASIKGVYLKFGPILKLDVSNFGSSNQRYGGYVVQFFA